MSIFFQEYRDEPEGVIKFTITKGITCRKCGNSIEVTGEFEVEAGGAVLDLDISDALTAAGDEAGWERKNCPSCVAVHPNLAREDHEEDYEDFDELELEAIG